MSSPSRVPSRCSRPRKVPRQTLGEALWPSRLARRVTWVAKEAAMAPPPPEQLPEGVPGVRGAAPRRRPPPTCSPGGGCTRSSSPCSPTSPGWSWQCPTGTARGQQQQREALQPLRRLVAPARNRLDPTKVETMVMIQANLKKLKERELWK